MRKVKYRLPREVVASVQDSTGQGPEQPDVTGPALTRALWVSSNLNCYQPPILSTLYDLGDGYLRRISSRPVLFTANLSGGAGHIYLSLHFTVHPTNSRKASFKD